MDIKLFKIEGIKDLQNMLIPWNISKSDSCKVLFIFDFFEFGVVLFSFVAYLQNYIIPINIKVRF